MTNTELHAALRSLHASVATALTEAIAEGDRSAPVLRAAMDLLKHNHIEVNPIANPDDANKNDQMLAALEAELNEVGF